MHKKDEYFIIGISCNLSLVNNLVEKRHLKFLYTNHQKWRKKKNTNIDYDNSSHHSCIQPLL